MPSTSMPKPNHPEAIRPVGGRLSGFRQAWRRDAWAYRIVSHGLKWTWLRRPPPPKLGGKGQSSSPLIREYVEEMIKKEAIEESKGKTYFSRIFPVAKRGTSRKIII